jgi:DNA-binding NtrC family response regulator
MRVGWTARQRTEAIVAAVDTEQRPLVLLTEEDSRVRKDIARYLGDEGFAVVEASDSREALGILKGGKPVRALVTDAHVPGDVDGFELAAAAAKQQPGLAVVLISGHSDASSGPVPEGGAFVSKPYLLEHLGPTLRRLIAH